MFNQRNLRKKGTQSPGLRKGVGVFLFAANQRMVARSPRRTIASSVPLAWMGAQKDEDIFLASLTVVAEIRRGILEKPEGRKREALEAWFAGRVLLFDEKAGLIWAQLMAHGKVKGRPRNALNAIIAAVAAANNCIAMTDNEKDFSDIEIVNPITRAM